MYEAAAVTGGCIYKHEVGEGLGAKYPKLSHCGSVSVLTCHTAMEGGKGRWWGGFYEMMVVVGWCVCKHEAGKGLGGRIPETERLRLGFGSVVSNCDRGR